MTAWPPLASPPGLTPGPCTGPGARWCPVHGPCLCHAWADLADPLCPLHGDCGTHR